MITRYPPLFCASKCLSLSQETSSQLSAHLRIRAPRTKRADKVAASTLKVAASPLTASTQQLMHRWYSLSRNLEDAPSRISVVTKEKAEDTVTWGLP